MKYFTISEMLKSDTARKHGIWNGATKEHEENLRALIENVLDPLRERYGKPIRVTSGYRCPKLNNLVGGAPNSQHMRGEAADIVAMPISTRDCGSASAMRVSGGALSKGSITLHDPSALQSPHGGEASAIPQAARGQNDTPKTASGVGPSTLRPGSATAGSGTFGNTDSGMSKGSIVPNDLSAPKSPHGGEASAIPQAARGQNDTPKTARGVGPSTLRPGSATAGSGTFGNTDSGLSKGSIVPNDPSAPKSRHCGLDPQSPTPLVENKRLGQLIEELGNFDQLIYEQCDRNGNPRWIHVSWKRNGWNRHQILKR